MLNKLLLAALAALAMIAASCESAPTGSGTIKSVTLRGTIHLYDEYGREQTDRSNVSVAFKVLGKTLITGASGTWQIAGVRAGRADTIVITKPGYPPMEVDIYVDPFATHDIGVDLIATPTHRIRSLTARNDTVTNSLEITGSVTKRAIDGPRTIVIIAGAAPNLSAKLCRLSKDSFLWATVRTDNSTGDTFAAYFDIDDDRWRDVIQGDLVYLIAYPAVDLDKLAYVPYLYYDDLGLGQPSSVIVHALR
jgi:hypothetical protein